MKAEDLDQLLNHIDEIVGPPENETVEEHQARLRMIERDAKARRIRKNA